MIKTKFWMATAMGLLLGTSAHAATRAPASMDLTGSYLGEAKYGSRSGLDSPAVRLYLHKDPEKAGTYWAVVLEYDNLVNLAVPYVTAQKVDPLKSVVGYLPNIARRITAYKAVEGGGRDAFKLHPLKVENGKIVVSNSNVRTLNLLGSGFQGGATITGGGEADIQFPGPGIKRSFVDRVTTSQLDIALLTYEKAHLKSTWRGGREITPDAEGRRRAGDDWVKAELNCSFLSLYDRLDDAVLEFSIDENGQGRATFAKSGLDPRSLAGPKLLNDKMWGIEGSYLMNEAAPEMFTLVPTKRRQDGEADLTGRIGLFLDVFDAQSPEAGNHLVVEVAFVDPENPEDILMYYQHPEHARNVGVKRRD